MCAQFGNAVAQILAMKYFKNQHARSGGASYGHERAVADVLKTCGFAERSVKDFKGLAKKHFKLWLDKDDISEVESQLSGLAPGEFVLQPAGSQSFPDIVLRDTNGRLVPIECKSGQTGLCPMWNDSLPKADAIYVLSSGIRDETTVFMGRDVITQATRDILHKAVAAARQVMSESVKDRAVVDLYKRGFVVKVRQQFFQDGGVEFNNYFTHPDRERCESNVLAHAAI
jgi:hypothetical protein